MLDLPLPHTSSTPAKPEVLTVEFYVQNDSVIIRKRRGRGPWLFLVLWLMAWSVGCIVLLVEFIEDPSIGGFAFGLPFWACWWLIAGWLVWMMFGNETLFVGRSECLFLRKAGIRISSRVIPREELKGFRECRSEYTINDEYIWGIEMLTLSKPVRFAFGLPIRERAWLIYQLNSFLKTSGVGDDSEVLRHIGNVSSGPSVEGTSCSSERNMVIEVLSLENALSKPPTDSRWNVTNQFETLEFWRNGQLNISAILELLFLNAFLNGILSVFLLVLFDLVPVNNAPQGWEWWALFVFLIPFELLGLMKFLALLIALIEPFRSETWRFESNRIVERIHWPLFRRTRKWGDLEADRLELRLRHPNEAPPNDLSTYMSERSQFELVLVSINNVDLCRIANLTEGEARWMAYIIIVHRPNWFIHSSSA